MNWGAVAGTLGGMFGGGGSSKTARHQQNRAQKFIKAQKSKYDKSLVETIYNQMMSRVGDSGDALVEERYGRQYNQAAQALREDAARRGMYRSGSSMENLQKLRSEQAYQTAEAKDQNQRQAVADLMGLLSAERQHQVAVGSLGNAATSTALQAAQVQNQFQQQDIQKAAGVMSEIQKWFKKKNQPQSSADLNPGQTLYSY